jgi:hypothetical protein
LASWHFLHHSLIDSRSAPAETLAGQEILLFWSHILSVSFHHHPNLTYGRQQKLELRVNLAYMHMRKEN